MSREVEAAPSSGESTPCCDGYWKGAAEGPWRICSECGERETTLAEDLDAIHAAVAKANIDPSRDILAEMYREDRR